jgi:hypothetical protein
LTGAHPTYNGKYYQLFEAPFAPKPVQQPHLPIVVGGQGEKWIIPIVARYADEWNVPVGVTPAALKQRLQFVREECRRLERSPGARDVSVFLPLANITNIPLAGSATRLGAPSLTTSRRRSSVGRSRVDWVAALFSKKVTLDRKPSISELISP